MACKLFLAAYAQILFAIKWQHYQICIKLKVKVQVCIITYKALYIYSLIDLDVFFVALHNILIVHIPKISLQKHFNCTYHKNITAKNI